MRRSRRCVFDSVGASTVDRTAGCRAFPLGVARVQSRARGDRLDALRGWLGDGAPARSDSPDALHPGRARVPQVAPLSALFSARAGVPPGSSSRPAHYLAAARLLHAHLRKTLRLGGPLLEALLLGRASREACGARPRRACCCSDTRCARSPSTPCRDPRADRALDVRDGRDAHRRASAREPALARQGQPT